MTVQLIGVARARGGGLSEAEVDALIAAYAAPLVHTHAAADITSGTLDNARVNWASPSAYGSTTPAAVSASALSASGAVTFNDAGADVDVRMEGDADANLFFLDASTDRIGIGTNTPVTKLHLLTSGNTNLLIDTSGAADAQMGFRRVGIAEWHMGRRSSDGAFALGKSSSLASSNVLFITTGNVLTLADAVNIAVNTTTGTKIGTATGQKLGFWNATPIIQPASANQAAVVTTAPTTSAYGYTEAQATAIITLINEIRNVLVNTGLMKGAA